MSYKPGDHKVICDQCGFSRLASECRMTWNNKFVCADSCWEPKHEQFVEPVGRHERQTVKPHRPEGDPTYIDTSIRPGDIVL